MHLRVIAGLLILAGSGLAQKSQSSNQFTAMQFPLARGPAARAIPPVSAQRTIEVLRAAGIITPTNIDRPFSLSSRQTIIDDATYLTLSRAGIRPERNLIYMDGEDSPIGASVVSLHWSADPDHRYVVDCAFPAGVGEVTFRWASPSIEPTGAPATSDDVPIVNGRAAIVLPAGAGSDVELRSAHALELSSCDITRFGS